MIKSSLNIIYVYLCGVSLGGGGGGFGTSIGVSPSPVPIFSASIMLRWNFTILIGSFKSCDHFQPRRMFQFQITILKLLNVLYLLYVPLWPTP